MQHDLLWHHVTSEDYSARFEDWPWNRKRCKATMIEDSYYTCTWFLCTYLKLVAMNEILIHVQYNVIGDIWILKHAWFVMSWMSWFICGNDFEALCIHIPIVFLYVPFLVICIQFVYFYLSSQAYFEFFYYRFCLSQELHVDQNVFYFMIIKSLFKYIVIFKTFYFSKINILVVLPN